MSFLSFFCESNCCGSVKNYKSCVLQNIKLSSIKVDSKFTTTMQIVKLSGSHTISKIALKITDLKRAKMVSRASVGKHTAGKNIIFIYLL